MSIWLRARAPQSVKPIGARALVTNQLALGTTRLLARITRASAERLALAPGMPVFAVIKSVTIDPRMLPRL